MVWAVAAAFELVVLVLDGFRFGGFLGDCDLGAGCCFWCFGICGFTCVGFSDLILVVVYLL